MQHALGRGQDLLAFRGQARIAAPALDDHHGEFGLQRPHRIGERGLGYVAFLGGTAEMAVLVQSHQVTHRSQYVHECLCVLMCRPTVPRNTARGMGNLRSSRTCPGT